MTWDLRQIDGSKLFIGLLEFTLNWCWLAGEYALYLPMNIQDGEGNVGCCQLQS